MNIGGMEIGVGQAYRFITDMGEDAAFTSLPGGIDSAPWRKTYDCWLQDYWGHRYHRLAPPHASEEKYLVT